MKTVSLQDGKLEYYTHDLKIFLLFNTSIIILSLHYSHIKFVQKIIVINYHDPGILIDTEDSKWNKASNIKKHINSRKNEAIREKALQSFVAKLSCKPLAQHIKITTSSH